MSEVLRLDAPTIVAVRAWTWALLLALAGLLWRSLDAAGVQTSWMLLLQCVSLWLGLAVGELCLARPLGRLFAEVLIYWTWPLLNALRIGMLPFVWAESLIETLLHRLAGRSDEIPASPIEEEIRAVVSEGEREGTIREGAALMIDRLIELHEIEVSEIMTPRTDMIMLDGTASVTEARQTIETHGHSRIPVFGKTRDQIIGILYAKDLLQDNAADLRATLANLKLRAPVYASKDKPVDVLLRQFQREHVHIAIVLDEYSGVAGLVTIEDILEEIVGEIVDEHDPAEKPPIKYLSDDRAEVDARLHVDELNELMSLGLPEHPDYDTLGGFVVSTLGHIPKVGEWFEYEDITFTVLDATDRAIHRVGIDRSAAAKEVEESK